MARTPVTATAKKLIFEIEERRELLALALEEEDEGSTFTRLALRMKVETWSEALAMVRAELPYIEEDAIEHQFSVDAAA